LPVDSRLVSESPNRKLSIFSASAHVCGPPRPLRFPSRLGDVSGGYRAGVRLVGRRRVRSPLGAPLAQSAAARSRARRSACVRVRFHASVRDCVLAGASVRACVCACMRLCERVCACR
jgi:hypothetical protein